MSSSVPRDRRTRRGETTDVSQLPERVRDCVAALAGYFGGVLLHGSYWTGRWADDSDIDIAVKGHSEWSRPIGERIGVHHGCKVDVGRWTARWPGLWVSP